ncbi:MAG: hypothetical protein KKH01_07125 [Firmicutes bacterium]|nr:hypothetical protein [Bacillota bacterium]
MARLTRESSVTVGTKEYKIDELLKTIIYLPADQIKTFFIQIGLKIPRELRMFVLRETLREKVIETRKSRLTLADELNYRLSWYTEFTESQLENLLVFFEDPKIEREFLEDFWTDLISYLVEKEVSSKHLKTLLDDSITFVKKHGLELPDMKTYNRDLKDLFFDSFGRIDGLAPAKFRPVLYKSSTLSEIRELGTKYEVDVPRRLKKTELADIIIKELKDRGQHTDKLEGEIRSMSVLVMQRFAIDHDIKASTELKKEEIIEYILANAKETKETYFVPESQSVYDKEVEEVAEDLDEIQIPVPIVEVPVEEEPVVIPVSEPEVEAPVEEEKVEAPVEEEKVEETQVQKVAEKPQVQVVQSAIDISELVNEIKKLRETFEVALLSQKVLNAEKEEERFNAIQVNNTQSNIPEIQPVVINSAEFYGNSKSLKKVIKNDEAAEREKFIEEKKADSSIGTGKTDDGVDETPGEIKFLGKMFKGLGKILWKLLKFLLKFAIIAAIIALVLIVGIAALKHYVPSLTLLDGVITFLNNFLGSGIVDRINGILGWTV